MRSGFSLLEVLVTVSMFALLTVGISSALHISLKSSQKAQDHLETDGRVLGTERILREQISALMPVSVVCRTGGPVNFFQGSDVAMRFVSGYSLSGGWRGSPHLLEFQVLPAEHDAGFRLLVNELPWPVVPQNSPCSLESQSAGPPRILLSPIAIGPASFVLADKLSRCRLLYLKKSQWLAQWQTGDGWPTSIRVELVPSVPDSARVELSSVTVPVHATGEL